MNRIFNSRSAVILSLQNPREKIWGVLLSVNSFGLTIRGIDINSFDDWTRSVGNQSGTIGLSTMFIPMIRVEKATLDESAGIAKSFSEQFYDRIGQPVFEFMNLPEEEDFSINL